MRVFKARFDGKQVVLPEELQGVPPGEVLLVFEGGEGQAGRERRDWLAAQEKALAKAWDNDEDAVYDRL